MTKTNLGGAKKQLEEMAVHNFSPLKATDIEDQEARLDDLQGFLMNAHVIAEAIYYERIQQQEAHAVSFFLAYSLEHMAHGIANDAVLFAMSHNRALKKGLLGSDNTSKGNVK